MPIFLCRPLSSPFSASSPSTSAAEAHLQRAKDARARTPPPWLASTLLPFILHSTALTLLLLLNAHVQILLRLAQTNPAVYWAAAGLMGGDSLPLQAAFRPTASSPPRAAAASNAPAVREGTPKSAQSSSTWSKLCVPSLPDADVWYLRWVVGWGITTTILWAGFFPPA
jgi:hypothetical protein